jgi:hypothetical protein
MSRYNTLLAACAKNSQYWCIGGRGNGLTFFNDHSKAAVIRRLYRKHDEPQPGRAFLDR